LIIKPGPFRQTAAEAELERRYQGGAGAKALYSLAAVCDLHRELFARLLPGDLLPGQDEAILPGQIR